MGGSYGSPKPESTAKMLQAYAQYLPGVLNATNSQAVPTAQATLAAEQATEPGYQQLNTDLTRQYAPALAQINSDVQRQQALAGAETNRQQIVGEGGEAARAATALDRETNPDFYKSLDAATTKSADLLNSYNLNGLSPGEAAAIERSTNQGNAVNGNLGNVNPTNVVSNALQFGQAFDNKRATLNTAIGTANNTANTARNTGFSPVSIALGQPSTTGMTQFGQSNTGAQGSSGALNFGQGLLGNMGSTNNAAIAAASARTTANSVPSYLGAMPSYS